MLCYRNQKDHLKSKSEQNYLCNLDLNGCDDELSDYQTRLLSPQSLKKISLMQHVRMQMLSNYRCIKSVNLTLTMSSSSFVVACCFSSLVLSWEQICNTGEV